jgi:hypothetical protein
MAVELQRAGVDAHSESRTPFALILEMIPLRHQSAVVSVVHDNRDLSYGAAVFSVEGLDIYCCPPGRKTEKRHQWTADGGCYVEIGVITPQPAFADPRSVRC